MYGPLVSRPVRQVFTRMSAGEWREIGEMVTDDVRHVTWGASALSGDRRSRDTFEAWMRRVLVVLPGLRFEVFRVGSTGWPWDIWAIAEWTNRTVLVDGTPYKNDGVTVINVRWGRVVEVHDHWNSEIVADACRRVAAAGIEEGAAAPING